MKYFTQNQLRSMFLDFFKSKDHYVQDSASLIPEDDPSILLIPAGMAPLKKFFSGQAEPPAKRIATCQKCMRMIDLENVGRTARHLTFFEMLGNFSFGDYFKQESLRWGMEFCEEWLEMDREKLWATVYQDDDEAERIWIEELGMPKERVVRLGKEDNFWEHGTGPCGPCSEIHIDRGEQYGCGSPDCKPGCDCDRYMEFWNHVFTQFNKTEEGEYVELATKNIDTGMGLERLTVIVQEVDNVFETDTMRTIINEITRLTGAQYKQDDRQDRLIRIVTDHIRSITFLISDGVIPSNEGRGYVLRKLLRRASNQMRGLGLDVPSLHELSKAVMVAYGEAYPQLLERKEVIISTIMIEEEKFHQTLRKGLMYLEQQLEGLEPGDVLPGEETFKLYDTFGFPVEITQEIAGDKGVLIDQEAFDEHMRHQKELARSSSSADSAWKAPKLDILKQVHTPFVGYDQLETATTVDVILVGESSADILNVGDRASLVLQETPFYSPSGGQETDIGVLVQGHGVFQVEGVEKREGVIYHHGQVIEGTLTLGPIDAKVDQTHRYSTMRNHSATHLLHQALTDVLGDQTAQAGSLVDHQRLRFDFNWMRALSDEEIQAIEGIVNQAVLDALPVSTEIMDLQSAKAGGAKALFSEKYDQDVRVVSMGDVSKELCGGTHVSNTGEIGPFKILSERGIASGIRRIEAITGTNTLAYYEEHDALLKRLTKGLQGDLSNAEQKLTQLKDHAKQMERELQELKNQLNKDRLQNMGDDYHEVGPIHFYVKALENVTGEDLKTMADEIINRDDHAFVLLGAPVGEKVSLISASSDMAIKEGYKAGRIIGQVAKELGGGGGGRDHFATAGGRHPDQLNAVLEAFIEGAKGGTNG